MPASTVYVFVFDTMADWEASFAVAGINNPAFQREPGRFRIATFGTSMQTITTIGGLRIQPDLTTEDISPAGSAMLILPGGESWERGENATVAQMAAKFLAAEVPVAAICAATLALARTGVLDHRFHTSNAAEYLSASGYGGGNMYRNDSAVTDGRLITAAGIAPVDFAYQIFKMLDLYSEPALEAWYALFRNGDPSKYYELVATSQGAA